MPCEAAWEEKRGWEVWEGTAAGGEAASKPGSVGPVRPGVGVRSLAPSSRLTQGHRTRRRHRGRDCLQGVGLHYCGGSLGRPEVCGPGWQEGQSRLQALGDCRLRAECSYLPQGSLGSVSRTLQLTGPGPPRLSEIISLT